jgi:hypothetical protein
MKKIIQLSMLFMVIPSMTLSSDLKTSSCCFLVGSSLASVTANNLVKHSAQQLSDDQYCIGACCICCLGLTAVGSIKDTNNLYRKKAQTSTAMQVNKKRS